jgi:hypothetical protein
MSVTTPLVTSVLTRLFFYLLFWEYGSALIRQLDSIADLLGKVPVEYLPGKVDRLFAIIIVN